MSHLQKFVTRWLAESAHSDDDLLHDDGTYDIGVHEDGHSAFGVHIEYVDLYNSFIFFVVIYLSGVIASRFLQMPSLVGEIVAGIVLGPPLINFVPNAEAFVLIGEVGLVLLVLEAGIDIDVSTLKLIGTRGFLIAIIGSILPIGLGIVLSMLINGTGDMKANIAAGASFGPTSLGIALNILRSGNILNTPVGQLIVSAAVIDDMIALIVLSQLESLVGTITVAGILVPVISAVAFLTIGGYLALYVIPGLVEKFVLTKFDHEHHAKVEMYLMFGICIAMMPATHYAKASYLMGAFISGLAFCTSHDLHHLFVSQFKRLMQWLMRVFFAASIGFQVPIKDLVQTHVLWKGSVFTLALLGKLAVGFLVPNFTQSTSFTGMHLRDCMITGFSMAAEGEFAFVIAVFAVDEGLIDKDLYASVVLAVLLSTIVPPFLLRFTISYYNKKAEKDLKDLANYELERQHKLADGAPTGTDPESLASEIRDQRCVFLCIQTQSMSEWGLMHRLMSAIAKQGLDIIDHRSWHPRGINTTLINEIYTKDILSVDSSENVQEVLQKRIDEITKNLVETINQPDSSKVKVQRWYPGVVEEIVESVHEKHKHRGESKLTIEQRLLSEAAELLDKKQTAQLNATKERTVEEILSEMKSSSALPMTESTDEAGTLESPVATESAMVAKKKRQARRRRQKMRSTPVVGGGLFEDFSRGGDLDHHDSDHEDVKEQAELTTIAAKLKTAGTSKKWKPDLTGKSRGIKAELIIDGESYDIRINNQTLKQLQTGFSGDMLDSRGVSLQGVQIQPSGSQHVVNRLKGYVRNPQTNLSKIIEHEDGDTNSDASSAIGHGNHM